VTTTADRTRREDDVPRGTAGSCTTPQNESRTRPRSLSERLAVPAFTLCWVALAALGWFLLSPDVPRRGHPLPAWSLVLGFAAAQSIVLNVQIRREARSIFLSEIPLVLGLLSTDPHTLVTARALSVLLGFGILRRQFRYPRKLVFNTALASAEATVAVALFELGFHLWGGRPPGVWFAAIAGTVLSTGFAAFAVTLVIRSHETATTLSGRRDWVRSALRAVVDAVPAAVFGALAAAAWSATAWSALPLLATFAALLPVYRAFASLQERHLGLERLYRFSQSVSGTAGSSDVVSTVLEQAKELLHAEQAWVLFTDPRGRATGPALVLGPEDEVARSAGARCGHGPPRRRGVPGVPGVPDVPDGSRGSDGRGCRIGPERGGGRGLRVHPVVRPPVPVGNSCCPADEGSPGTPGDPCWEHPSIDHEWIMEQLRTGRPVLLHRDSREPKVRRWLDTHGVRDSVIVRLWGREGTVAVLGVDERKGDIRGFDDSDVRLLETVANQAATALRNSQLLDQLRHESLHDPLTGLPNRTMLHRELASRLALRRPRPLAVAILDLDEFKDINDTLGHLQGDLLLQEVSRRVRRAVQHTDTLVVRLGGDEFAIVRFGCDRAEALGFGRELLGAFGQAFEVDGLDLTVNASIGISLAPDHGTTVPTLLKRADLSMYEAKQLGCGVRVFEKATDTTSRSRLALITQLRQAIASGQIQVHVQPKTALADGTLRGVEALARWTHPRLGPIPPTEFIPLAERSGLIGPLTEHVLKVAVTACAEWQHSLPGVGIAVNISLRSLTDDSILSQVDRLLRETGLRADLLTLEITESSIMTRPERTMDLLHRLRARGVRLSIDDFGTGYTTLSYLRNLPVDEVKIDKSFLQHEESGGCDPAIVGAIVGLGRNLGLSVVAEGISDRRIWNDLVDLGCEIGQGYAINLPLPLDEGKKWMIAYRDRALSGGPDATGGPDVVPSPG
jgi:diguanylate cyclase (GGDEF)-like protein